MRAVAQRVRSASVVVENETVGAIERGLLVYLGAQRGDANADLESMADKLVGLRVFPDADGKMSLSVADIGGSILVVSQFTLFGDVRRGRRPSFEEAEEPARANDLYESLCARLRDRGIPVQTGRFRAHMNVHADVDGPVTILIDSRKLF